MWINENDALFSNDTGIYNTPASIIHQAKNIPSQFLYFAHMPPIDILILAVRRMFVPWT